MVHEGGYRIEWAGDTPARVDEQFQRQQATEHTLNEVEKRLRNSRESFEQVCQLSPTRFRFRVVDQNGQNIRHSHSTSAHAKSNDSRTTGSQITDTHSTSVDKYTNNANWSGVADKQANYRVFESCL